MMHPIARETDKIPLDIIPLGQNFPEQNLLVIEQNPSTWLQQYRFYAAFGSVLYVYQTVKRGILSGGDFVQQF